jgi:hypothetical protein
MLKLNDKLFLGKIQEGRRKITKFLGEFLSIEISLDLPLVVNTNTLEALSE